MADVRQSHSDQHEWLTASGTGVWGKAIEVPGLGALNKRGYTGVAAVAAGAGEARPAASRGT